MATQIKRNGTRQATKPTQAQLLAVWADEQAANLAERDAAEAEASAHEWAAYDTPAFMRGCSCNACEAARAEYEDWGKAQQKYLDDSAAAAREHFLAQSARIMSDALGRRARWVLERRNFPTFPQ